MEFYDNFELNDFENQNENGGFSNPIDNFNNINNGSSQGNNLIQPRRFEQVRINNPNNYQVQNNFQRTNGGFNPNYNLNQNSLLYPGFEQEAINPYSRQVSSYIDETSEYQKSVIQENNSSAKKEYFRKLQKDGFLAGQPSPRRIPRQPYNYYNGQEYYQEIIDFDRPISYGNYDYNPYQNDYFYGNPNPQRFYQPIPQHYINNNHQVRDFCNVPGCEMSINSQNHSNPGQNQGASSNESQNYFINDSQQGNQGKVSQEVDYSKEYSRSKIIPKQILKEIFSEKMRVSTLLIIGLIGFAVTAFFTAAYFTASKLGISFTDSEATIWGVSTSKIPHPFWMISLMIISISFFLVGLTDLILLRSNIKKYEKDLRMGYEQVPYFITKNYRSIVARSVYINWISFTSYVLLSITLGILYGLQSAYDSGQENIYLFFWKIGILKSFTSEITVTIVCLLSVLGIHISNIVLSKIRKNNIISYYGYEILPREEIRAIRKHANKICMIIFFVTLFIVLFLIVIPIILLKKKKGVPFRWPWQMIN
ncbi:hypothetical protein SSABA_v1c02850 [Spiroplasma sabaudiense Ar-1343]|uniref:Transmembrane protein n=1 Tax=Spiroplasma sabaudiense Ar-1343 TaxID=1276257 RepID=W6A9M3_9MOLU|nr:hypothetical protein [Spiroplasma sabaudiense]AHI53697.1 hypothetical protein SSABA_v1c02850 [Spiroplasma sabaudiense Ar-1343]